MKLFLRYHRLTLLWALFIFVLCSIRIGDNITHQPMFFPGFDKLVHCGFFFVLVAFWCNGIIRKQKTRLVSYKDAAIATITSILYGGVIELLQLAVFTWRSADWSDFFADSVGACMSIFCVLITERAIHHEQT